MTLTPQQQKFVEEYLVDLNGTRAAIRAGYAEKSAFVHASRLLRNAKVADAIDAAMQARGERTKIDQDRVVKELARVAFSDIRGIAEWDGERLRYIDSEALDDEAAAAIQEITDKTTTTRSGRGSDATVTDRREVKIKLYDKMRALELVGRHLGMFKDAERETSSQVLAQAIALMLRQEPLALDAIVAQLGAPKEAG